MKKITLLLLIVGTMILLHFTFSVERFEITQILKQKDVPSSTAAPVAIANDGMLLALEYRELNPVDNHMYAKISIWNVASGHRERTVVGRLDDLIESNSFQGYLIRKIEQSSPVYSDDGARLGITRTAKASQANVLAKAFIYNGEEKSNTIQIYGATEITVEMGHNKPLIGLSPDGKFLAVTMEDQIDVIDAQTGQLFQHLPISLKYGQAIVSFFFYLKEKLHLAAVCKEETVIFVLKRTISLNRM